MYLDDSLTGGERQPHEAGVVDGHDLVSDAELAGASRRAAVHHVGEDNRGQYGAPAGLHDHHPQDLAFALLQLQLRAGMAREEETIKSRSLLSQRRPHGGGGHRRIKMIFKHNIHPNVLLVIYDQVCQKYSYSVLK